MIQNEQYYFLYGICDGLFWAIVTLLGLELTTDCFRIKRGKVTPAMRFFGSAVLLEMVANLFSVLNYTFGDGFVWAGAISRFLDIAIAALICLTGPAIITDKYPSKKLACFVFLPLFAVATPVLFNLYSVEVSSILVDIILTFFFCVQIRLFLHRDNRLKDFYSNTENREVSWYMWFIVWFILNTPLYYYLYTKFALGEFGFIIYGFVLVFLYGYMAIQLLKLESSSLVTIEKDRLTQMMTRKDGNDANGENGNPSSMLSPELKEQLKTDLTKLMEEDKIFHKADLSTDDLTKALHTNSSYLYYFMRDVMGTRFYDFVNGYRIEEAKQLLIDTDEKIECIALDCGFNSYNTFVSAFKKALGESPSTWRKKMK